MNHDMIITLTPEMWRRDALSALIKDWYERTIIYVTFMYNPEYGIEIENLEDNTYLVREIRDESPSRSKIIGSIEEVMDLLDDLSNKIIKGVLT